MYYEKELETAIQNYLRGMEIETDVKIGVLEEYVLSGYAGIKGRIATVRWLLDGRVDMITSFRSLAQDKDIFKHGVYSIGILTDESDIFCPFRTVIEILDEKEGRMILYEKNVKKAEEYIKRMEVIDKIVDEALKNKTLDDFDHIFDINLIRGGPLNRYVYK